MPRIPLPYRAVILRCARIAIMRSLLTAFFLASSASACLAQTAAGKDEPESIQINDQLTNVDPIDRLTGSHHKVHVVKLLAGKSYQITLVRKDAMQPFSPYLRIEDAAGKELTAQQSGQKVRLNFSPTKDDTYRLITSGGTGEYILKIAQPTAIKSLKDHDLAKTIDLDKAGFELTHRLTDKDPRDRVRQQMFAKVFLVKMVKGKTYSVEMASRQFDAYLRIEDAAGKQLAEDDDSGGNLDALIVFRASESGVFRIITTSFAPGAQGEFLLRVQEE
jgi:hypothetical protein